MAFTEVNYLNGGGGGGKSDSGTLTLPNSTQTIPLSFEPSRIICKFANPSSPTTNYAISYYDVNIGNMAFMQYSTGGQRDALPNTAVWQINSVSSSGFTVKGDSGYSDFSWWAYAD